MSESDGINEIFDDLLRQALMLAARLGEQAARARQQHIERARAQSEQAGREALARFDAERQATRLALAPVQQGRWWESATPEQIGAAYQSATAWANEDSDIARTRRIMDEQLAQRGVSVTGAESGQVTALVQAKQWAAEKDPLLDSLHTREMVNSANPRDRERLNNNLVAAWLASPEGPKPAQGTDGKSELDQARQWAQENDPKFFSEWDQRYGYADTADGRLSDERDLIRRWQDATNPAPAPGTTANQAKADGLAGESEKLRNAAYYKEAAAAGARGDGDAAASRADDLHRMTPLDMETGPTSADAEWYAQEAAKADALASEKWDTAERREEFAQSLHGKADQVAVDARVLADVSQGTHPSAAVKGAAPSATKARKNNRTPRSQSISKGGR